MVSLQQLIGFIWIAVQWSQSHIVHWLSANGITSTPGIRGATGVSQKITTVSSEPSQSLVEGEVYSQETSLKGLIQGKRCLAGRERGPTPVILMNHGRFEGHSTWRVLGNLTGMETPPEEIGGVNPQESKRFFEKAVGNTSPNWIVDRMCFLQWEYLENSPQEGAVDGIVGSFWEPFVSDMRRPMVSHGLRTISSLAKDGHENEIVRVLRTIRNPVDIYLEQLNEHHSSIQGSCHGRQCNGSNEKSSRIIDPEIILRSVKNIMEKESMTNSILEEYEVPTFYASYENLYYPESPDVGSGEWNKILAFLGKSSDFSWEEISNVLSLNAQQRLVPHRDRFQNFQEVKDAFRRAGLQELLRDEPNDFTLLNSATEPKA